MVDGVKLVELVVDDRDDDEVEEPGVLELWVTPDVGLRVPADIDGVLLRELVLVIARCS